MNQELSHEARALLALAKEAVSPDDADVARARAVLMGKVGVGIAAGAAAVKTAGAGAATKAVAGSSLSLATKVMLVTALVGTGITGGYVALAHRDEAPVVAPPPPPRATQQVVATAPRAEARADAPTVATEEPAPLAEATPPPSRARRASTTPAASMLATAASTTTEHESVRPSGTGGPMGDAPAPPALTDDIGHLREAQRALVRGDPTRAYDEASRVRKESPLAEEAEGMAIVASCSGANPAEGRTRAADFARRRPDSSLLARIRSACAQWAR